MSVAMLQTVVSKVSVTDSPETMEVLSTDWGSVVGSGTSCSAASWLTETSEFFPL